VRTRARACAFALDAPGALGSAVLELIGLVEDVVVVVVVVVRGRRREAV